MKSKFAKITDRTLGAALVFVGATAVMRYYAPGPLAAVCGLAITGCVMLVALSFEKRIGDRQRMSAAARDMFFELMFYDDRTAAKMLHAALVRVEKSAVLRGNGIFLNNSAVFCCLNKCDGRTVAGFVRKAEKAGATKLTVLTEHRPEHALDIDSPTVRYASGDEVYRLFGSLGALPANRHKNKSRTRLFSNALDKDRLPKYAALSAAMFAIFFTLGRSTALFICASLSALLFLATAVAAMIRAIKN